MLKDDFKGLGIADLPSDLSGWARGQLEEQAKSAARPWTGWELNQISVMSTLAGCDLSMCREKFASPRKPYDERPWRDLEQAVYLALTAELLGEDPAPHVETARRLAEVPFVDNGDQWRIDDCLLATATFSDDAGIIAKARERRLRHGAGEFGLESLELLHATRPDLPRLGEIAKIESAAALEDMFLSGPQALAAARLTARREGLSLSGLLSKSLHVIARDLYPEGPAQEDARIRTADDPTHPGWRLSTEWYLLKARGANCLEVVLDLIGSPPPSPSVYLLVGALRLSASYENLEALLINKFQVSGVNGASSKKQLKSAMENPKSRVVVVIRVTGNLLDERAVESYRRHLGTLHECLLTRYPNMKAALELEVRLSPKS
jgi:hypothetical protein